MKIFPLSLLPANPKIDFMRMRWVTMIIGLVVFIAAIGAIATQGFNYALDFTGGTSVTLRFDQAPDVDGVREKLAEAGHDNAQVQTFGSGADLLVRLRAEEEQLTVDQNAQLVQDVIAAVSTPDNPATVI
ncbi:MAG TPA: protein translocase subunit SecF, partial [Candidatus Luteimonas excrementigallinarum]|nr:protein translocase subunit SecF [Candidatus Luteimonas excrementigallinarum]